MYLKRLEVSGFKSFAGRIGLDLEPGVTAIVGPNGSGKSNLADAIRWVLGEQSARNLRLKRHEEIVFAGTDQRPKASLAEVTLLLDNSDGRMALDFSEVEISRRLYGSGESEYRLMGRKVRLNELQQLLAAAGFGTDSYTVIGQGMIDSFVLATPAERKTLFDEASGIRQHELRRDQSLRKLEATRQNALRVQDILSELEPRLSGLTRQVEVAEERQKQEQALSQLRGTYIATATDQFQRQQAQGASEQADLERMIAKLTQQSQAAEAEREALAGQRESSSSDGLNAQLAALQTERDGLTAELGSLQAQVELLQTHLAAQTELEAALRQATTQEQAAKASLHKLTGDLKRAEAASQAEEDQLEARTQAVSRTQRELSKLRLESEGSTRDQYLGHALGLIQELHSEINGSRQLDRLRLIIYKLARSLKLASNAASDGMNELRAKQTDLIGLMKQRDDQHEHYARAVIKVRSLELDVAAAQELLERLAAETQSLKQKLLERQDVHSELTKRQRELAAAEKRLVALDQELAELRARAMQPSQTDNQTIFALAEKLESHRSQLAHYRDQLASAQASEKEIETRVSALASQAKAWFGGPTEAKPVKRPLEELERELWQLEAMLSAHQSADHDTLEEYGVVRDRHEFLTAQLADLEQAVTDLTAVIARLDKLIESQFEAAFGRISTHFGTYFKRLFGGGSAHLKLERGEDGGYGIEITATLPGKRGGSLAMLSGGERSMTGLALLAAILVENPSPFVVMDEVDAALDEANSARLGDILGDLAKRSQLIVITHNRRTMTAAHSLFGVTMDDHKVSRLLSMRLEEAAALAAR